MLRCLSAELSSTETKNWAKLKITKSGWLGPLYQDMLLKVCYKVNLLWKKPLLLLGPQNTLQMSLLQENYDELRALAYTKILALVILITCHITILVSYIEKIYWFSPGFIKNFNFGNVALDYMSCPIDAKHFEHHKSKINWIFQ